MRPWIVSFFLALACAACSQTSPEPWGQPQGAGEGVPENPQQTGGKEINALAGGSVSLGVEATLTVPAGSLEHDTFIEIARLPDIPMGPADGFLPFGQGYELTPHGTQFSLAHAALLSVRVDTTALTAQGLDPRTVQLFHFDEETQRYVNVAGALDPTGTLVAAVEHFSKYVLMAQTAALGDVGPVVTMQAPVPNPLRAGAPIYLRATVLPTPGTSIVAVRVFYRKLQPAGQAYQIGVMEPDNAPVTPGPNTYGFVVPASALGAADLGAGNDFAYYAEASDSLNVTRTLVATPTSVDVTRVYLPGTLTLTPALLDIAAGFEQWLPLRGTDNLPSVFQMVPEGLGVTNCPGPDGGPMGTVDDQRASGIHFHALEACTGTLTASAGSDTVNLPVTVRSGKVDSITLYKYEQLGGTEVRTLFDGTYTLSEGHVIELDALGNDAYGNTMDVNVTWQADSAIGTIDGSGRLYGLDGDGFGQVTASVGGVGGVSAQQWFNVVGRDWTQKGDLLNVNPLAEWVPVDPRPVGVTWSTATRLPDDRVLVVGGNNNSGVWKSADLYNPETGGWTSAPGMSVDRHLHTANLLLNGKVLVTGGHNGPSVQTSAELYDPATNIWIATGSMNTPRYIHAATLLPTGNVLVTGGVASNSYNASAELYDPSTGTWISTPDMSAPRFHHTATLLANGKVLVTGGHTGGGVLATAEIYDPAANTWAGVAPMGTPRHVHTATLLPSGNVLVVGGHDGSGVVASAELYDPGTGTWTPAGTMATPRDYHTATLLPNGEILVTGGDHVTTLATAEIYNPSTNIWKAVGSMNVDRHVHNATLLSSGRILVNGGYSSSTNSYTASAEVYMASQPAPRPTVAVSGTLPYVAWHETDAIANRIYVKHWTGTAWTQDGTAPLNVDPSQEATYPKIAMAGSTPYVAWQEKSPTASQIQVKRWNGGAWIQDVPGSLNVNVNKDASAPSIATSGATPYVAWEEAGATASQIYVRRWSGTAWAQLGGSLNQNPGQDASSPSTGLSGTTPYVAFQETSGAARRVYVKHWNGSTWVVDGASLNVNPAADASEPALIIVGTTPTVAWQETLGANTQMYVAHWTGTTWLLDGPSFSNDPTAFPGTPAVGFFNGTAYVAWHEELGGVPQTYVKHRNSAAWLQNGASLNVDGAERAFPPSLAFAGPTPFAAWAETTGSVYSVYAKALE